MNSIDKNQEKLKKGIFFGPLTVKSFFPHKVPSKLVMFFFALYIVHQDASNSTIHVFFDPVQCTVGHYLKS